MRVKMYIKVAILLAITLFVFSRPTHFSTFAFADDTVSGDTSAKPEFGGMCAMAVADGHMNEPGEAQYSTVIKGKTYYFCSQDAKNKFLKKAADNASFAHDSWARAHAQTSKQ